MSIFCIALVASMRLFIPVAALLFLSAVLWLKIESVKRGEDGGSGRAVASEPFVLMRMA